jgi:hypothetical protein
MVDLKTFREGFYLFPLYHTQIGRSTDLNPQQQFQI